MILSSYRKRKSPIINIFTYKLPFKLANQIYNEFQGRRTEVLFLINNSRTFKDLNNDLPTIELLLAMSIFYKRIIANIQGAVNFYSLVTKYSSSDTISVGSYKLTGEEKNKMLGIIISFNKILEKYNLTLELANYSETKQFLTYVKNIKQ